MANTLYEIRQHFSAESARFLPKLPKDHPCGKIHGHSFKITLVLRGPLNEQGWLVDFNDISRIVKPVIASIDHQLLNEVKGLENPTSENLCKWLFDKIKPGLPQLCQVTVAETPQTECSFIE